MHTVIQHPDPWLLAHGVLFILDFSILMPVASFLIYYNRVKYYQLHSLLGIIITVLLVAGWASLAGAATDNANGNVYSPMSGSGVGLSHSVTGIVARFVAVVVCILGVCVGVLRMPARVRTVVRISHGIGGVAVSLYGPSVVWNGFVRLAPFDPAVGFFNSTPIVWYSVVIGLLIWIIVLFLRKRRAEKYKNDLAQAETEMLDLEQSVPMLSIPDAIELITSDKEALFVFHGDSLIRLPKDKSLFDHPGGLSVLSSFVGKDIAGIFTGTEPFSDEGRQRFHAHSAAAIRMTQAFRVGRVQGPFMLGDGSTVAGLDPFSLDECTPMYSIDEDGKSLATIVEKTRINESNSFPVIRFRIRVDDPVMNSLLSGGMKVRLALGETSHVSRTYTVVAFAAVDKSLDLVIKIYPDGTLTSKLVDAEIGDIVVLSSLTMPPLPRAVTSASSFLFLAAGTGLVPIMYYLERAKCACQVIWSLRLAEDLFFAREVADLLRMKREEDVDVQFTIMFTGETEICAHPEILPSVEMKLGRIDESLLAGHAGQVGRCAVMSGPNSFVTNMHSCLCNSGFEESLILSLD